MQHVITTARAYLGISQAKLAKATNLTQHEICHMENQPPYGLLDKYRRLGEYLGLPLEALVKNDYRAIPESFFKEHPAPDYMPAPTGPDKILGRQGEEYILRRERERLANLYPALAKLVLPYYKMKLPSPGYDILSFDDLGQPLALEVKTSQQDTGNFRLTNHEVEAAKKLTEEGWAYKICYITNWGTEAQQVRELPFGRLVENQQLAPLYYRVSTKAKEGPFTGLAYYRLLRGLKQEEVAAALGVARSELSFRETGLRKGDVAFYIRASELLDATVDQLDARYDALPEVAQ